MSTSPVIIVLHGPESTGKSVLGQKLAKRLNGAYVPEYGRTYCEMHGHDCNAHDLTQIANGQIKAIEAAVLGGAELVISDTDAVLTDVWAEMMLGHSLYEGRPPISGAFYLLTDIDVPFVDEPVRVYGADEERRIFFTKSQSILDRLGIDYVTLSGDWAVREASALAAIQDRFPAIAAESL